MSCRQRLSVSFSTQRFDLEASAGFGLLQSRQLIKQNIGFNQLLFLNKVPVSQLQWLGTLKIIIIIMIFWHSEYNQTNECDFSEVGKEVFRRKKKLCMHVGNKCWIFPSSKWSHWLVSAADTSQNLWAREDNSARQKSLSVWVRSFRYLTSWNVSIRPAQSFYLLWQ